MNNQSKIGLVGLGLMGRSIAACLLAAGHEVVGIVRDLSKAKNIVEKITSHLKQLKEENLLMDEPSQVITALTITNDYAALAGAEIVLESVTEDPDAKKKIFADIEKNVSLTTVIGSNTSAIPVTILQEDLKFPERMLGIHWGEPAHISRFMEIICGEKSGTSYAFHVKKMAEGWGKEPSVLLKDIRGFITNRLMYALLREAFFLVEKGYASYEDIDRACRNDMGSWITLAGPFRFMDITGVPAYLTVAENLFPELDNSKDSPAFFKEIVERGAKGVSNANGFYEYTPESAKKWEELFNEFSYDIRKLSEKYLVKLKS